MKDPRTKKALYPVQITCAVLATLLSIYLLVQHTRLKTGIQEGSSFCAFSAHANCDVVNASAYSEFMGVPLAAWGAILYFVIFLLSLLAKPGDVSFKYTQQWIARFSLLALVTDIGLLAIQLFALHNVCVLCVLTYAFSMALAFTSIRLLEARVATIPKIVFLQERNYEWDRAWTAAFIALVNFGLVMWLIPNTVRLSSQTYAIVDNALSQFYDKWSAAPKKDIATAEGDGVMGPDGAAVKVVEFSDFECPHCRRAAFLLHTALTPLKDRVQFVFKNYPLDNTCNPAMQQQLHPNACALARLGYCAGKAGNFWDYHDKIFLEMKEDDARGDLSAVQTKLEKVMPRDAQDACLKDPASLKAVQDSLALGTANGVRGTPAIFINGKQVTIPLSIETLQKLIALESR